MKKIDHKKQTDMVNPQQIILTLLRQKQMKIIKSYILFKIVVCITLVMGGCGSNSQSHEKAIASLKDSINDKTFLDFTLGDSLTIVVHHLDSLKKINRISDFGWTDRKSSSIYWCGNIPEIDSILAFESKFVVSNGEKGYERPVRCELQFYKEQLLSLCILFEEQADTILVPKMYQAKYGDGFTCNWSNVYDTPNYPNWEKSSVITDFYSYARTQTWEFKNSFIKIVLLKDLFTEWLFEGYRYQEIYEQVRHNRYFKDENEYNAYIADAIIYNIYEKRRRRVIQNTVGVFYVNSLILSEYKNVVANE